ncbi:glycerol-3-phosphate 1-O-acyltransferase [Periweissella cryptocerci]|uniref:Glycerol-3-phosphate acyltransferase n=1 Tax=Periweissella cryptocerci TaxID=2506420 RepID=A0A4P6YWD5_9LACO|nr:glycerol-3-phosphate 1-O-acyltransferase PlsY [Periweissella cryptocerci]QBO37130.1 glycerol-3-phosphate 1-O-acyltransferase [Periweissella cryptocerci]
MEIAFLFVLSYFLGACPFGYWIGKIFYHEDIRTAGSGNIGTTNTFRVLGVKAGSAVMVLDVLKGTLAASLPHIFGISMGIWTNPFIIGLAAIIGHMFSIWIGFKGGKAVATTAGVLLAYDPHVFVLAVIVFAGFIFLTSMVSVGSIVAFLAVDAYSLFNHDWFLFTIAAVLTVFIIYKHRTNIVRIIHGNENQTPFGLVYWLRKNK